MGEIEALVRGRSSMYERVLVELALLPGGRPWRIWFGCFRFLCEEEPAPEEETYDYGTFRLVRWITSVNEALDALRSATVGKALTLRDLHDVGSEGSWGSQTFATSGSGYGHLPTDWPTTLWEYSLSDANLTFPNKPLVCLGQVPIYPNAKEAVRNFFGFHELEYFDIRASIQVLIPDFRARIGQLRLGGKRTTTRLDVRKAPLSDLVLKLYCRTKQGVVQSGDLSPLDNEVVYDIPDNPMEVLACLMVKEKNELLDWKQADLRYPHRHKGVIIEQPQEVLGEIILRGETDKDLMGTIVAAYLSKMVGSEQDDFKAMFKQVMNAMAMIEKEAFIYQQKRSSYLSDP